MKRTLISIVAVMFAAASANAALISAAATSPVNVAGAVSTVTITLTTLPGETVPAFGAFGVAVFWNPTVVRVLGSNGTTTFGKSAQSGLLPGASGSLTPSCFSAGANKGKACTTITQSFLAGGGPFAGGEVVIGTLLLEVLGGDATGTLLGLDFNAGSTVYNNNGQTNPDVDANLTVTASFATAQLVPEPATAALLGLGLVGLGIVGRRRA